MLTIGKQFRFSASHVLMGLGEDHPCGRVHGHNYTVTLSLTGQPGPTGMVLDYRDLGRFGDWVDDHLDHRHLNDTDLFRDGKNPTAENLALALVPVAEKILQDLQPHRAFLVGLEVRETDRTFASWTR